jgi:hypothetical protein
MKGQVFAITLVVVSGVATFIMFISTMDSISLTRNRFYRDYHFADVFVKLKRAPESLKEKIQNVPGVHQVETRVSAYVKLDIKGRGKADPRGFSGLRLIQNAPPQGSMPLSSGRSHTGMSISNRYV